MLKWLLEEERAISLSLRDLFDEAKPMGRAKFY
jgi:hypothetical protein